MINPKKSKSGYDKYVNYKTFGIAVGLFALILVLPMPASMLDVAVEYSAGEDHVLDFLARDLFGKAHHEVEQWQSLSVRVLEKNMRQGALARDTIAKRSLDQTRKLGLKVEEAHFEKFSSWLARSIVEAVAC